MMQRTRSISTLLCAATVMLVCVIVASIRAQEPAPTQAFSAYRKALASATTYQDVFTFVDAKSRAFLEPMPAATQAKMFELLKKFADTYTDVAVTKETVTGDTAMLELSGKDPKGQPATGSVPMTREASGWKVGTEKWSSKPR